MQGTFINGRRPASKKELREALRDSPDRVRIEATSIFGDEYDGPASEMPEGVSATIVGPDPYTKRNWYGQIVRKSDKVVLA